MGSNVVVTLLLTRVELCVFADGVSLAYQRVQKVECSSPRPVLVLGPLVEASKDMLVKEARFCRCLPGELPYCLKQP